MHTHDQNNWQNTPKKSKTIAWLKKICSPTRDKVNNLNQIPQIAPSEKKEELVKQYTYNMSSPLIVDDTLENLHVAWEVISNCTTVATVLEAIEELQKNPGKYSIVITDMNMGNDSEAGNHIREISSQLGIPSVIFTGWGGPGHLITSELSMTCFSAHGEKILDSRGWDFADKNHQESWSCLKAVLNNTPQMTIYDWEIEDNLWRTPQNIIPIWISAPDLKQSILKRYGEYSYIVYFDIKGHYEARAIEKHNEKEAARLNMSIQELVDLSYEKIIQIGARGLFGGLTIPLEQKLEKEKEHYGPQKPQFLWKYGEYEFYEQIDRCWWPQGDRNYKRLFYKHWDQEINLIGKAWHVEWWTGFQILSVNWRTIEVRNKYNDWYTKGDEVYTFSLDDFWAKEQARTTVRSLLEAKKEKH